MILKNELLLARGSLKEAPPNLDEAVEKLLKQRILELGAAASGADLKQVRKDVKEFIKSQYQVVGSRQGRRWVIETGLAREQIATALTKGARPDGRMLAPIMPWHAFATLTPSDVGAIVAYLRSIPAVSNKVPGPFGATEKPTSFVMKVVPPEAK